MTKASRRLIVKFRETPQALETNEDVDAFDAILSAP
jgi:hypothetical protein